MFRMGYVVWFARSEEAVTGWNLMSDKARLAELNAGYDPPRLVVSPLPFVVA